MMAVIVGTALQLGEDGVGSPSAIFLIALSGSFFIAACLHPQEFWCVVPGLLYLMMIPSMYLLLILYSIINLNVVSWGTREVLTKKSKKVCSLFIIIFQTILTCILIIRNWKESGRMRKRRPRRLKQHNPTTHSLDSSRALRVAQMKKDPWSSPSPDSLKSCVALTRKPSTRNSNFSTSPLHWISSTNGLMRSKRP